MNKYFDKYLEKIDLYNKNKHFLTCEKFGGYASLYGIADIQCDVIKQGAFDRFLKSGNDIPLLWAHNQDTKAGVIKNIQNDDKGLWIDFTLNSRFDKVLRELIIYKLLGLSIGFSVIRATGKKGLDRIIKDVNLIEISLTMVPALDGTIVYGLDGKTNSKLAI